MKRHAPGADPAEPWVPDYAHLGLVVVVVGDSVYEYRFGHLAASGRLDRGPSGHLHAWMTQIVEGDCDDADS